MSDAKAPRRKTWAGKFSPGSSEEAALMSRIGKRPVEMPSGVSATLSGPDASRVKGPERDVRSFQGNRRRRSCRRRPAPSPSSRGGSPSARVSNGACRGPRSRTSSPGVTEGFKKELEINGVGYRAQVQGKTLKLALGYSHDVDFEIPEGIDHHLPEAHRRSSWKASISRQVGRGGCQYPRMAASGTLQGQGHQIRG